MNNSETQYDLVIVGGGMVGASLAIALSGHGLKMCVVEAHVAHVENVPNYDDRAIALAYGSRRIFEAMGIWGGIDDEAQPIRDIHVSDRGHFGFTRLNARQEGVPALGHVVTARALGHVLLDQLACCDDVEVLAPAGVVDFSSTPGSVQVVIEQDGQHRVLHAGLLVAADGGKSFIREQLVLPTQRWQYGQSAIVTNISAALPHHDVAYERFTDSGPIALLPMTGGRCGVVWTVRDEQVDEVMALDDEAFIAALQRRFGFRLGRFERVGHRYSYPLSLLRAKESVRQRTVVIGNAAHTLHPIAGQGFNLGLRDVAALAEVVLDARSADGDVGKQVTLQRYARWREKEQRNVALATDGLARIFSNPLGPLRFARNLGLLAVDLMPGGKHLLARAAMGLLGRLPKMGRGVRLD